MKVTAILLSQAIICAVCHQACAFSAVSSATSRGTFAQKPLHAKENDDVDVGLPLVNPSSIDRRSMLSGASAAMAAAASACVASAPLSASAAGTSASTSGVTPQELLARSRRVPCFAIVNNEGIPYVIVDKKTGFGTGYFFLTFSGALSVLGDAEKRAKEEGNEKVWEGARITTVPLDIALRLTLKKVERTGQVGDIKRETISDILPGMDEREAASKLDKSGRFDEQGSVPVFYAEEGLEADDGTLPVYFSTATLVADWNRIYGGQKPLPTIKVVDLLDIFQGAMRGTAKLNPSLVPTEESIEVVKELQARKLNVPYKADQMVMVGGKS